MNRVILIALLGLGLSACATDASDDGETQRQELKAESTAGSPAPSSASEIEAQAKRDWNRRAVPEVQDVDWDDVGHKELEPGRLPVEEAAKVAELEVPVLVPDVDFLDTAFFTRGEHWYTVDLKGPGHSLVMQGTRAAFKHDLGLTDEQRESVANFTVYRSHGIATLAFNHFGVAYAIDVECDQPFKDARCTRDDYLLEIAENLVLAGGSQ